MGRPKNKQSTTFNLFLDLLNAVILPVTLMLGAKLITIAFLLRFGGIDYNIQSGYGWFTPFLIVFNSSEDRTFVLSYSNFAMFLVVFIGAMIVATRSILLVKSKLSYEFLLKLAKYDLLSLLASFYIHYKEVFIWGVFLIIISVYCLLALFENEIYSWMANLILTSCLIYLWVVIQNIQFDILLHKYDKLISKK